MMNEAYLQNFKVCWADLDANGHMRNTAYLDYAAQTRFSYFSDHGFSPSQFAKLQLGPIVFKDEVEYFKEMYLLEKFQVNFLLAGMNKDGSRFQLVNEIYNQSEKKAAVVTSYGAWFDLQARKITPPPQKLFTTFQQLKKTENYSEIVSHSKPLPS